MQEILSTFYQRGHGASDTNAFRKMNLLINGAEKLSSHLKNTQFDPHISELEENCRPNIENETTQILKEISDQISLYSYCRSLSNYALKSQGNERNN